MVAIDSLSEIKDFVANALDDISPDINVVNGFPASLYFGKLTSPVLSVMINNVTADKNAFSDFYGNIYEQGTNEVYATKASIVLGLYLSLPESYTEADSNDIFISVCNKLLFNDEYPFEQISCDEIYFDDKTQSLVCSIKATTSAILTKSVLVTAITDLEVSAQITH